MNGVKAKKVVQVVDTADYGVGAASAMKEALGKAGVKLAQMSVELAQPDYASIMSRLKNENPDAEVVYYDVSETATAYVVTRNATSSDRLCLPTGAASRAAAPRAHR